MGGIIRLGRQWIARGPDSTGDSAVLSASMSWGRGGPVGRGGHPYRPPPVPNAFGAGGPKGRAGGRQVQASGLLAGVVLGVRLLVWSVFGAVEGGGGGDRPWEHSCGPGGGPAFTAFGPVLAHGTCIRGWRAMGSICVRSPGLLGTPRSRFWVSGSAPTALHGASGWGSALWLPWLGFPVVAYLSLCTVGGFAVWSCGGWCPRSPSWCMPRV